MNHFQSKLTSPLLSICIGYIYICILIFILYLLGIYKNSTFFKWGPPLQLLGYTVEDQLTFYAILVLFFIHQLINNWVNDVTYPWIINCVQDPKNSQLQYSRKTSLLIVNMFAVYSEVDVLVLIAGVMSQISFFLVIILANMISITIINWQYIKNKKWTETLLDCEITTT